MLTDVMFFIFKCVYFSGNTHDQIFYSWFISYNLFSKLL